jgi:hypothetical protein
MSINNGQSGDKGNIGHKTQNEDKQSQNTSQKTKKISMHTAPNTGDKPR